MELRIREVDEGGCKTQRFKWSSCSGASPSQLLCLKSNPHQLMGSKRKNKKKAQGKHQRINIRRSIRRKLQKQWVEIRNPGERSKGPFSRREEGWE